MRLPPRLAPLAALTAIACAAPLALAPREALASPWTLPRGTLVLSGTYNLQTATTEFLDPGEQQLIPNTMAQGVGLLGGSERRYPLRGRYMGNGFTLGARFGITDRLELEFSLPIRSVGYESDPVLLLPRPAGSTEGELAYYQRNVLPLSRAATGIGDVSVAARYGILRVPFVLAGELRVKVPAGYAGPEGTFGSQPTSANGFASDVTRFATPGNIRDDVTLGDGQVDVGATALLGYSFPTRTFVRVDLGYVLRLGGAADQVMTALRAGQQLGDYVLLYAWGQFALAVERGDVIGVSVAATDPELPSTSYAGATNLTLREVQLRRSALDVGGGLIVRFTRELEVNVGFSRTLWGVNTAATNSLSIGFALRNDLLSPTR